MGKPQRSKQRKVWADLATNGYISKEQSRHRCYNCEKIEYHSKHEARGSLAGQLRSKSMRVYPCPVQHDIWHITKDYASKRFIS